MTAAKKSAEPFVELHRRYHRPLVAFFFRRTGNWAEAEDLTQEAFLRLARHPDAVTPDEAGPYIFQVAANLLLDHVRYENVRQRSRHQPIDGLEKMPPCQNLIEGIEPERVLSSKETLGRVLHALDELNHVTRTVFMLYRLENMKQREIAALLGISLSMVEKHIARAMAHLIRRTLQP